MVLTIIDPANGFVHTILQRFTALKKRRVKSLPRREEDRRRRRRERGGKNRTAPGARSCALKKKDSREGGAS